MGKANRYVSSITNRNSGGGSRLQGITPNTNISASTHRAQQFRTQHNKRNYVFCINQLAGGVGRGRSMFVPGADGVVDCVPGIIGEDAVSIWYSIQVEISGNWTDTASTIYADQIQTMTQYIALIFGVSSNHVRVVIKSGSIILIFNILKTAITDISFGLINAITNTTNYDASDISGLKTLMETPQSSFNPTDPVVENSKILVNILGEIGTYFSNITDASYTALTTSYPSIGVAYSTAAYMSNAGQEIVSMENDIGSQFSTTEVIGASTSIITDPINTPLASGLGWDKWLVSSVSRTQLAEKINFVEPSVNIDISDIVSINYNGGMHLNLAFNSAKTNFPCRILYKTGSVSNSSLTHPFNYCDISLNIEPNKSWGQPTIATPLNSAMKEFDFYNIITDRYSNWAQFRDGTQTSLEHALYRDSSCVYFYPGDLIVDPTTSSPIQISSNLSCSFNIMYKQNLPKYLPVPISVNLYKADNNFVSEGSVLQTKTLTHTNIVKWMMVAIICSEIALVLLVLLARQQVVGHRFKQFSSSPLGGQPVPFNPPLVQGLGREKT